jgi:ATP-dependent helicase/nuclease subunit A
MSSNILEGLDGDQKAAVISSRNTVVTAGAGSGKTTVLSSRYLWLIMEKGLNADEILTLTFTNKAANEMYSRIYSMLMEHRDNERVKKNLEDFHLAGISTLDSFCAAAARIAAGRWGISPDFSIDREGVQELAVKEALPFALEHRGNEAVRMLMAENKIREVAEELFAGTVLNCGSVSSPVDFDEYKQKQGAHILSRWKETSRRVQDIIEGIRNELGSLSNPTTKTAENFRQILNKGEPPLPDMEALINALGFFSNDKRDAAAAEKIKKSAAAYFRFLYEIKKIRSIDSRSAGMAAMKEYHDELKNSLYDEFELSAAYILQADISAEIFSLLDDFQKRFNNKKRISGMLSFNDVSHLAADSLLRYRDIRRIYQEKIKAIMVDEFQDNNSLQKNLIYLIAERPNENEGAPEDKAAMPGVKDLYDDKMFFVGDEKQSIYRFRGADVSVFRSLGDELSPADGASAGAKLVLSHNYRSLPALVDAFNWIFGGLAPNDGEGGDPEAGVFPRADKDTKDYEASYTRLYAREEKDGAKLNEPALCFCFLDKDEMPRGDPYKLSAFDLEAAFIAGKIRSMVEGKEKIQTRKGSRPCGYQDFAVLQRGATHQGELERQFRNFGIPYSADDPAGLFNDAPINDLYSFLRLMVYPGDRESYAAVLRSPITGLSDRSLAFCLVGRQEAPFEDLPPGALPAEEMERYRESGDLYRSMLEACQTLGAAEILTRLWYGVGYRYETVWSASSRIYGELFDFFFELARKSDERGKTLADFLDYFDGLIRNEEKIKDLAVPVEKKAGVRIMTIHKSKGLEFPVVFLWGAGSKGSGRTGKKMAHYSDEWGCAVNLPRAEELPGGGKGNYFYNLQQQEEYHKETAELRRLLYVAMTRAESRLFVSASLPIRNKEDEPCDTLAKRLAQLRAKPQSGKSLPSFLDLLLPSLTSGPAGKSTRASEGVLQQRRPGVGPNEAHRQPPDDSGPAALFTLEPIPVLSRDELQAMYRRRKKKDLPMAEAAAEASFFYNNAPVIGQGAPFPASIPASKLHLKNTEFANEGGPLDDDIAAILEKAGLDAADFGSIVHAFLEDRLNKRHPLIPPRIFAQMKEEGHASVQEEALKMADCFLASSLGQKSAAAPCRESEFPLVTAVNAGDKTVPVTGQIDLLFEENDAVWVVDFKTDRLENPRRHYGQLAVYSRAVSDIFSKPVRAWIYYLRSGNAVEVSADIENVSIEELVSAACAETD